MWLFSSVPADSCASDYLLLLDLCISQHRVVPFVLVSQTQAADAQPVRAAVHLQQLVMPAANGLLEYFRSRDQLVFFKGGGLVMRLDVELAVGGQTDQAGADSFAPPHGAHVAFHVGSLGERLARSGRGLIELGLSKSLHHVGQHCVSGEQRPRGEVLPALGAGEDPQVVVLVPVALDAIRAIAVSAGDGHGVFQDVQTYRAVEMILVQNHLGLSHQSSGTKPQEPETEQLLCLQEVRGRGQCDDTGTRWK